MSLEVIEHVPDADAEAEAAAPAARRAKPAKSKKLQLLALISKPAGTRISVLCERLGWQAHTVRAALSGMRKQGHQIHATKAPKTGEAVYRLITQTQPLPAAVEPSDGDVA